MDWVYGLDLNLNVHPQGLWIGYTYTKAWHQTFGALQI